MLIVLTENAVCDYITLRYCRAPYRPARCQMQRIPSPAGKENAAPETGRASPRAH